MSRLEDLRGCVSLKDLAEILGLKASALSFVLYKIPDSSKYTTFTIPKKTGGTRTIDAPIPQLKIIQKRLANLLSDCLGEIEDIHGLDDNCAISHGFHVGRSIVTNALR